MAGGNRTDAGSAALASRDPDSLDGATSPDTPAGVPASALGRELREGRTPPTLVAVLIAWSITLAPPAFARGTPGIATVIAIAALGAGLAGPLLARTRPRAGRHLGISLFAALSTLVWLLGSQAIHPIRLDPIRGAFGAIAWGVFALSWSERWSSSSAEAAPPDPDAPALLARATLPPVATLIAAAGVAAGLGYLVLAWRVKEPDRALVAQTLGLLCAVGVITASGTVATARGKRRVASGRRLTPPVVRALLLLVTVAIVGAVITALR